MTRPRRHIEGQSVMLTRRCRDRYFFLRPGKDVNSITRYEFSKAANRYGLEIHGLMVMSNHPHIIATDYRADRSDFMRDSMSGIAKNGNKLHGRSGSFWDEKRYNDVILLDQDALEEKLLYVWLNPVEAGLVKRAEDWPGYKILPDDWGKKVKIPRSGVHNERNPEYIEFVAQPPPGYEEMTLEEVKAHFNALLKEAENEIGARFRKIGKKFMGIKKIRKIDPFEQPKKEEEKTELTPMFASKNRQNMMRAIEIYKTFIDEYETKRQRWQLGKKVEFPCGTIWLKKHARVKCQESGGDEPGVFIKKSE